MTAMETLRLRALEDLKVLDTPSEKQFDDLVELTRLALGTKIAVVSLVHSDRQWFKAKCGLEVDETARDISFCNHAIKQSDVFVVANASLDPDFKDNPLVTGAPYVRFYAGAPLITPDGHAIGTLCAIDDEPRFSISEAEIRGMRTLADVVMERLLTRQGVHRSHAA
jgi:GAF domain-containing protein